jgi:hypothetical protein
MKKVYLFLALNVSIGLSAQTFEWAKAEGESAYDYGYGANTDKDGNLYVAGKYEHNGAKFSGTTVACAGNHDGFLVKYAPDGTLKWIRTFGGPNGDYSQAMYCDKTSAVYIAGEIEAANFNTTINFPGSTVTVNAVLDNDIIVAKYDLDGNLLWAKSEGSGKSEKALGVTADKNGNVYICGYYTESTKINGTTINGKLGRNIFIAKYDKDGVFQWFRDGGSDDRDEGKAVACDSDGNVYLCGYYSDNCTLGTNNLTTYNNTGEWDAYLAKYDTNGNLLWVKTGGGDVDDGAWGITIDNENSIYITGEYAAYAKFGQFSKTALGGSDTYVAKYNSNGDIQWFKGAGSDKYDRARGIGTDGTHIFITGQYGGTALFGGAPPINALDTSDIYIATLDKNGNYKWAVTVQGPTDAFEDLGYESGNGVTGFANGPAGAVYATGGLLDGGTFGNTVITKSGTRTEAFVTKVTWDTGMPPLPEGLSEYSNLANISVFPNPGKGLFSLDLGEVKEEKVTVNIYNYVGQLVSSQPANGGAFSRIDLTSNADGVYLIEVQSPGNVLFRNKLIVQH